jgi:hypothetical protein
MTTAFDAEDWYPELEAEINEAMTLGDILSMDDIDDLVAQFAATLAGMTSAEEVEYN